MSNSIDVHNVFAKYFKGTEALAYAVSQKLEEGSICLDAEKYIEEMEKITDPGVAKAANPFWNDVGHFRKQMQEGHFVTHDPSVLKPFIVDNGLVYLQRYHRYETSIEENIKRLGKNFFIITGGPGTGKTFSVGNRLVEIYKKNPDRKVALAAPTGKAAARMEEAIRDFVHKNESIIPLSTQEKLKALHAQTIHRLLSYIPNSVFFRHNKENPLPYDVLVIDEASMIDGAMMAKLLDATGNGTQLFLIGDKDQLASVEAGSVFGDMCRAKDADLLNDKVVVKEKVYRTDGVEIIPFSKKIIGGDKDFVMGYKNNDEVVIDKPTDGNYSNTLFKAEVAHYSEYIEVEDIKEALKNLNKVRVLCVTREHDHSVAETNKRIEKLLAEKYKGTNLFSPKAGFYHNQPIIITKNDYDLGLNNGDVGLIRRNGNEYAAWFEDAQSENGYKTINAGYLNHYDTVFAMTIHKSQGSEFDNVVVLLPEKRAQKLLTRELLYTAVTRAKKKVLIQATPEVLEKCIDATVSRASGLTQRLNPESK